MTRAADLPPHLADGMHPADCSCQQVRPMTTPTPDRLTEALPDADKLRTLATWFDRFDDWRESTGKIAPGIADYREVQADLRRIAAALATHPEPGEHIPSVGGWCDSDVYLKCSCGWDNFMHEEGTWEEHLAAALRGDR